MVSDPKDMSLEEIMTTLSLEAKECSGREYCLLGETSSVPAKESPENIEEDIFEHPARTLQEFLVLPCKELVEQGYGFFLGRPPDPTGKSAYIEKLESHKLHPVEFLLRLRISREGRSRSRRLPGLFKTYALLRVHRIPVFGRILGFLVAPFVLPQVLSVLLHVPVAGSRIVSWQLDRLTRLENRLHTEHLQSQNRYKELEDALRDQTELCEKYDSRLDAFFTMMQDQELQIQTLRRQCLENERHIAPSSSPRFETASDDVQTESVNLDVFYTEFEDCFRGPRDQIKQSLACYLPFVQAANTPNVLDLGCGRGEWLELLAEQGVPALGVDTNGVMVREGRQAGYHIERADVFEFLNHHDEKTFSAVTSFHLIEHLPFPAQIVFLDAIYRVLVPGGVLILETPNPRNILVGSGDFYRDPTHNNPVFPDSLAFMARQRGFARGNIFWKESAALIPAKESTFDTLTDYVNVGRDYAYIGYVPCV
jgi:O-antigen chain-terminating methyltransferase